LRQVTVFARSKDGSRHDHEKGHEKAKEANVQHALVFGVRRHVAAFESADMSAHSKAQPPAMAPIIKNGSDPFTIASGNGVSGNSCDKSSPQAKNRTIGRRSFVT